MNISFLEKTALFAAMSSDEILSALQVLSAKEKSYRRGETILYAGDLTDFLGLIIKGSVTVENNDMWGNRVILSHVAEGQFFAETYAILPNEPLQVDVVADEDCEILFLKISNISKYNRIYEGWISKLVFNLLTISVHKNLALSNRSFHTAPKTIRGRVMSYLNSISLLKHSTEFDIPFDRQQLADYLNLDRSALSKELGKMQRDGLIAVNKNHFILRIRFEDRS